MVPPMARAETYGDIARLEQLLDEHATIAAMDPAKLPAIRAQIWTLIQAARLDHDLGLDDRPHDTEFDDFILHVDGWLCEVKDAQIRDGLHVLGEAPEGAARVDLVLAMLRARQMWSGRETLPGLREALGLREDGGEALGDVDAAEAAARDLVQAMEDARLGRGRRRPRRRSTSGGPPRTRDPRAGVRRVRGRPAPRPDARRARPRPARAGRRLRPGGPERVAAARARQRPADRAELLLGGPARRPERLAWETGQAMAASLLDRYRADHGEWPRSVGLSVWGTSAMRTAGDDVAEVLALLGVRPEWDEASRRVTALEPIPVAELGGRAST